MAREEAFELLMSWWDLRQEMRANGSRERDRLLLQRLKDQILDAMTGEDPTEVRHG